MNNKGIATKVLILASLTFPSLDPSDKSLLEINIILECQNLSHLFLQIMPQPFTYLYIQIILHFEWLDNIKHGSFSAAYLQIIDFFFCLSKLGNGVFVSNVTNIVALFFSEDLSNGELKQV